MRDEIAEKYADAAKRRSNYQMNFRRPRTTSLAAVEERKFEPAQLRKLSQHAAARVIQRSWRRSHARRIATRLQEAGINLETLKNMDFEDVTKLISTEKTMTATMRMVSHLGMLDHENDENARRGSVRVFLSAFMVVAHPVQAFSHGGKEPQEKELVTKGQALINAVQSTSDALIAGKPSPTSRDQLQFLFQDFTSGFHAWKSQDLGVIADVMVGSFVNLDLIVQATKDDHDGNVAEEYLNAIRTEQTKILVRLKRMIGHEKAMTRIKSAVRRARKERSAQTAQRATETTEHIPRVSTPVDMEIDLAPGALLTPPATPVRREERPEEASSFVTRLGHTMTVLPPNREIAHEIQVNGMFEVEQQPWTDSKKELLDTLRRGMDESIRSGGIESESAWTHSMALLVKDKLMHLVSERHPLHKKIEEYLDARLIEQQVRVGQFVYADFFNTISSIIRQICSPGRDEVIKEFSEDSSDNTIHRLFSLINILDLMTLDHINFQFRLASKHVIEHGHEHEQTMFKQDLDNRVHDLSHTKAFWQSGRANIPPTVSTNTAAHANAIYARALTDLVLSNTPLRYSSFPETLRLDYIRLLKLRARVFHFVTVASTLLTSKIRLRRNREALWTKEASRLIKQNVLTTDVARIVSQIESGHMMPDATRSGLIDFVSRVLPPAVAASRKHSHAEKSRASAIQSHRAYDPSLLDDQIEDTDLHGDTFAEQVATFVLKSLREHIYARLAASSTAEKVRVTGSAGEVLARIGMPEFVAEVAEVVEVLEKVKVVDLRGHEAWYDQVAREIGGDGIM